MRAVIDMLDVRRAQVFVEALVAEVSADKAADFGVQWMGADAANSAGDQVGGRAQILAVPAPISSALPLTPSRWARA